MSEYKIELVIIADNSQVADELIIQINRVLQRDDVSHSFDYVGRY